VGCDALERWQLVGLETSATLGSCAGASVTKMLANWSRTALLEKGEAGGVTAEAVQSQEEKRQRWKRYSVRSTK
jgi:hypothetical protein